MVFSVVITAYSSPVRPLTTTETFGRTLLLLLVAVLAGSCGDSPAKDDPQSNSGGPAPEQTAEKRVNTELLPKCTSLRDGDLWRVHVSLPASLPDGASISKIHAKSAGESFTVDYNENLGPIIFLFSMAKSEYEVAVEDDQGNFYPRKATFQ